MFVPCLFDRQHDLFTQYCHTVLTQAANVKLQSILSIDYSWGEIDLDVRMQPKLLMDAEPMCTSESYNIDVEPDDIEATDTVTVTWEIG